MRPARRQAEHDVSLLYESFFFPSEALQILTELVRFVEANYSSGNLFNLILPQTYMFLQFISFFLTYL